MSLGVVWLKRDLRLHDHAPLVSAALRGPLLCIYIVEPSLWAAPDAARQHYGFLLESLRDLYKALRAVGGRLHVLTGEAVDVFERLHRAQPFDALYSHEETGNWPSFQRDIAVGRWCRSRGVEWQEFPQFGVVRRLADRNTWHKRWEAFVTQPCLPPPQAITFAPLPWPDRTRSRPGRPLGVRRLRREEQLRPDRHGSDPLHVRDRSRGSDRTRPVQRPGHRPCRQAAPGAGRLIRVPPRAGGATACG